MLDVSTTSHCLARCLDMKGLRQQSLIAQALLAIPSVPDC
jgi:hypothetical protein